MAVENYHLKWDSHVSYLNSSVATLYKNEKFADVVLYSSSNGSSGTNSSNNSNQIDNAIPTVGISAHKFILSSCSQFFATLFDNTPIPTSNGVLYVVLPPELSHRAIQILVQYIYTGEATVSNDILNEVLRGGEILKIRGLCRTATQREPTANSGVINSNSNSSSNNGTSCSNSIHCGTNGTRPQHNSMLPPSVIHGTSQLATDLYTSQKCSAQNNQSSIGLNGGGAGTGGSVGVSCGYGIEHLSQTQSSIHSQIRGLGASVMPKDSPVIVKSPKLPQMGQLTASRESKQQHHGIGITINKEVAIDPDDNCCYQAAVVPNILHHESMQMALPNTHTHTHSHASQPHPQTQSHPLINIDSGSGNIGLCNDVGCKNCLFKNTPESVDKQGQRQQHLSQNEELPPHRLPSTANERLERTYSDDRCESSELNTQLNYNRQPRNGNGNERVSNYYVTDHYEPSSHAQAHLIAAVKTTPTNINTGGVNSSLNSPPLYPHNFLTIKQEPIDWTTPQSNSVENADNEDDRIIDRVGLLTTSPQLSMHGQSQSSLSSSPKQPLDFKIPVGNAATATVKIEAGASSSSHSADEDEHEQTQTIASYSDFSRLVCDICKKSFDEPKLWVQHLESHNAATSGNGSGGGVSAASALTTTTTASTSTSLTPQMAMATNNSAASSINDGSSDTLNKSYVPKKRRRVSQQENNMMDHVTLLCDLCNTSFDTPAEWVRHMNSQHTEIELAMFNSKKDKEQKSTNTSVVNCNSGSSRNHNQHNQHHQHYQQQHHQKQQHHQTQKKYSNRGGMSSTTHNRSENITGSVNRRNSLPPSSPPPIQ